jgi:hypothetical protein
VICALTADIRFDPPQISADHAAVLVSGVLVVPSGSPVRTVKELVELTRPSLVANAPRRASAGRPHPWRDAEAAQAQSPCTCSACRACGLDLATATSIFCSARMSAIGQVQAGNLRVLGWTASKRTPTLPDVPTMAEAGYAGVELEIWQGIMAPVGTPPAIVRKLNTELIRAAKSPDVVEKVAAQAVEMTTSTPEDFAKLLASDIERLGKLISDAGLTAQ